MITKSKANALSALEKMNRGPLTLGNALYALRMSQDLTQIEMAKKLKITKQHLSQIEKGQKFVSPERAAEFAKKLHHSQKTFVSLSLQDLLSRAGFKYKIKLEAA
jgi:transcriptional regulator with XRE-family HTH domain